MPLVGDLEVADLTNPPDMPAPAPEPLAVVVRADPLAGDIIAGALAENGIESMVEPIYAPSFAGFGYVRVIVRRSVRQAALAVIEHVRRRFPKMVLDFVGMFEVPPLFPGF